MGVEVRASSPRPVNLEGSLGPLLPGTTSGSPSKAADTLLAFLFYRVNPFLFPFRAYTYLLTPPTPQTRPTLEQGWGALSGTLYLTQPSGFAGTTLWFCPSGLPTPAVSAAVTWTLPFLSVPPLVRGCLHALGMGSQPSHQLGESPSATLAASHKPPCPHSRPQTCHPSMRSSP